jgi:CRP-like cAMP-binding protein
MLKLQQNEKKYEKILQSCPLFDGVLPEELALLLDCLGAVEVWAEKGKTIRQEGDKAGDIGIVLSGAVQLSRQELDGKRSIVAHVTAGELFGEAFAFADGGVLPVTVTAEQDCLLMLLDSRRLSACCPNACQFHNRVIFNLLRISANKNKILHQKLQILSKRTTRERLLTYLQQQAMQSGARTFTIPYDRQALADFLEVDRSGLSVQIGKLCQEGVITCRKRTFCLL